MPELPELVQVLLDPKSYPYTPLKVELMQTQMSFIFLAGDYVYKVKKAVNLGYLDYTTLDKRHFFCQQEVKLNRRLCPEAYLGVVPIIRQRGRICLEGKGKAIEYAVKMRQLPRDGMMDVLLSNNRVSPQMVASVAEKLAAFHRKAETNATISAFGNLDTIMQNTRENFTQTEKYIGSTLSLKQYQRLKDYTESFIAQHSPLFRQRVAEGRIRDCHGDLHAAHICFQNGICIYDCIEFNDRFRYCDVASEVAFLVMDLDHYGRADLSRCFINDYINFSQDSELNSLVNFYKCYRAYVRGKVESFKFDDPYITSEEKRQTLDIARSYFDLACAYTRSKPVLFITAGLVGTGKTTLAQALAKRLGLTVISSDVVRKQLAGVPLTEHRFEEFDAGIYSAEFSRKTYDKMLADAQDALNAGSSVILDASFMKSSERVRARTLAEATNADFFIIECILEEESARQRLARRLEQGSVSDGRWAIFAAQKKQFDPVTEAPETSHIKMDNLLPMDENIQRILNMID